MKYLSQFLIILAFTILGEALQRLIPLPIPASVYGIVLLFGALMGKLIRLEQVKDAAGFLSSILPVLFVPYLVGILENWDVIRQDLPVILLLVAATTLITFAITGKVAQAILDRADK